MLGVIGTLGTSDVRGSALTLPIGVNPDTGAMYVDVIDTQFNVGTLTVGTINKVGTVSEVTNGSIIVTVGTIINIDEDYDTKVDESAEGTTYYGFSNLGNGTNTSGTVWKIMQKVYDATASTYLFADGDKLFNNSWDARGTLTYS
jgi:hypothetical protein